MVSNTKNKFDDDYKTLFCEVICFFSVEGLVENFPNVPQSSGRAHSFVCLPQ